MRLVLILLVATCSQALSKKRRRKGRRKGRSSKDKCIWTTIPECDGPVEGSEVLRPKIHIIPRFTFFRRAQGFHIKPFKRPNYFEPTKR